jgi:dCTP deaminase
MIPDHEIRWLITSRGVGYTPFDPAMLNPASIDMTLDHRIREPKLGAEMQYGKIDCREVRPNHTILKEVPSDGYDLLPGKFILASTVERVALPDHIASRVEGKSSLGRIGLIVHSTAGFIDPGFIGQVTLEIVNLSPWTIVLHRGMRIAQMGFEVMSSPASVGYAKKGHYSDQDGPTESRYRMT